MEDLKEVIADPWGDESFRRINPPGKIPALVTDEDDAFFDSPVICEYLDALVPGSRLFLRKDRERWQTLTVRACTKGLMDAAYLRRNEAIRQQAATVSRTFVDRRATRHFLLVARGEGLDIEVREQPLDVPVAQRGALDSGRGANALDPRNAAQLGKTAAWLLQADQPTGMRVQT